MGEGAANGEGAFALDQRTSTFLLTASGNSRGQHGSTAMNVETVETKSQPILFLSRSSSMDPSDIGRTVGEAFGTLGAFIGKNGIAPAGPPVCIYRSWDKGKMGFDVGFPVSKAALAKAAGEVKAGETPSGKALKAIHHGPYAKLRDTYGKV